MGSRSTRVRSAGARKTTWLSRLRRRRDCPSASEETMNPVDEFLKRELDCQRMAKFARDPQSRASWLRMAERWRLCAEKFVSNQTLAASRQSLKRHSMSAAG